MKRIKNTIFFIIILLSVSPIINAQTVEDIIAKHIKAHGGEKNWEAIESMNIKGKFTAFSIEKDFFSIKTQNGSYYSERHLGKHYVKEAFNGKTGWTIDPWQEILFPRDLNKTEINVFCQKAEFFTPFYKYKEKGHKVELLGEQKEEGVDVYLIKLTRANGNIEKWFLNSKTYLEFKYESLWVDFAFPSPGQSFFDDFRTINGVVIPFYVERTFSQRSRIKQIESIEFNTQIDESLFEIAKSKEIKKLAFLYGNWDVKVEVWTGRGGWYPLGSTVSNIKFEATNMLQEKINYDRIMPQAKIINYSYNSSTKKYRLAVFNNFSSTIEVFEGNFDGNDFFADNVSISYGEAESKTVFSQISISEIESNSFIMEIKQSKDGGKTWNASDKFSYKKKE